MSVLVHTRAEFAAARAAMPGPVGVVTTMGALHAGHAALLAAARPNCAALVATVFVNPLQFGAGEDLSRYPRTLAADVELCGRHGVDVVWAPATGDIYPDGQPQVTVDPGPLGAELEGAVRPGHFTGVLTVVAKLFALVRPDRAWFGEKDYQQLVLIQRMTADLDLPVDAVGVPTVREPEGLALSSRNVYLSTEQRQAAVVLSRALRAGVADPGHAVEVAAAVLATRPDVVTDYLQLRAPDLGPAVRGAPARLLVAARVGTTRLIDNLPVPGLET